MEFYKQIQEMEERLKKIDEFILTQKEFDIDLLDGLITTIDMLSQLFDVVFQISVKEPTDKESKDYKDYIVVKGLSELMKMKLTEVKITISEKKAVFMRKG